MPRVSIILPVYNGAKTIRATIQSALHQTFTDFELIVIDDGSCDSTRSILDECRDPRVTVRTYPNRGLAISRNRGLSLAGGEFVAFLDADDLWLPDKLRLQLAALDEDHEAALAYAWTDYIDDIGRPMHPGQHARNSGAVLDELLVNNFIETGSNPVIRRGAIAECGGFDESLSAAEDWDLWLRLAMRFRFVVVPQTLLLYRVHPDSMSSADVIRQERCSLQVIEQAFHRVGASQSLKRQSVANLYKYLTYRALTPPLSRGMATIALRFWRSAVTRRPALLVRSTFTTIALLKIAAALVLPFHAQRVLLETIRALPRPIALETAQSDRPLEDQSA